MKTKRRKLDDGKASTFGYVKRKKLNGIVFLTHVLVRD